MSGCGFASGGASGKRAGNSAASLRDSRAKASTAAMRRSSFLKRATRVVVSACTSPVIAWYQSAPGDRRNAVSRSCSVAARVRSAAASGPVSSSRPSNEPRAANAARTASSCARTSSRGSRATARLEIFQPCSIEVLTRISMPVSRPEYRVSNSRRTRRDCTNLSALFLCSAMRRGSWLGAGPVSSRYLPSARSSAERALRIVRGRRARVRVRVLLGRAIELAPCAQHLGRHRSAPGTAHRLTQRNDLLGVERAALHCRAPLMLEDGDTVFDDEICGRRQRANGNECDDQPRHDADAAQREPTLQAHVLTFELMATVLEHERRTELLPTIRLQSVPGVRFDESAWQCACPVHAFV